MAGATGTTAGNQKNQALNTTGAGTLALAPAVSKTMHHKSGHKNIAYKLDFTE
jgi:hypothetical protein